MYEMKPLDTASLGAITFCASRHKNEECGINGLPLTPNSIRILGCFRKLTTISHPNLSLYLDLVRGKYERVFVVFEHYGRDLSFHTKMNLNIECIIKLIQEILLGLNYLNKKGLIHACLAPKYVLLNDKGSAVLSNYGLFHMTESGKTVPFHIGNPKYMAPELCCSKEIFRNDEKDKRKFTHEIVCTNEDLLSKSPKRDVWSLGLIVLELICKQDLWSNLTIDEIFKKILNFIAQKDVHPLDVLLKDHGALDTFQKIPESLQSFIRKCLQVRPSDRPTPEGLLSDGLFEEYGLPYHSVLSFEEEQHRMFPTMLRSNFLQVPVEDDPLSDSGDMLSERRMDEFYYLWKLAGGDIEGTFKKLGRLSRRPPIMNLPCFVGIDGETFGLAPDSSTLFDDTVVILPQNQLRLRLRELNETAYYPLLEFNDFNDGEGKTGVLPAKSGYDLKEVAKLPLVIRENDVEYQFHRVILFKCLLDAYPHKKPQILKECRIDIPPLFRAQLWAAILEVEGDVIGKYGAIDKESPSPTDRQIEVDIPRCHQYNPLLSSPVGHQKFKRLLKAWVASHSEYVYWQGLDSLCAPFLYLNFNDEATAFACLCAFIPKYLHNFFLRDNAPVIQEYLAVFSHLIAFHDPVLFSHLDSIGFIPDLYSIPWFLTMYAHVFPLHKVFHLWDTLMLGNSSFPLCTGVAILKQLRDQLLTFGFNECILLFSDMPEIDMERCVQDSIKIFCTTPKSITHRLHAGKPPAKQKLTPSIASFYSKDYYNAPKTHLSIDRIPLDELRSEKCARISAEDLIEFMDLRTSLSMVSPKRTKQNNRSVIVTLDVRPFEEYHKGSLVDSLNVPHGSAFNQEGNLASSEAVNFLSLHKSAVKVVLGDSSTKTDLKFGEKLIKLGHSKVCILHKGVDILRTEGLLTVSSFEN